MSTNRVSFREINRLAVPAMMAGIAEPLIGIADTAILGHLGTPEQGGVGVAASFYSLLVWVLAQTKSAISAIVSRYYGSDNLDPIPPLIPQAVGLTFGVGLLLTILTKAVGSPIFEFYSAKGEVLTYAVEYYQIRAWGLGFTLATMALFGVFRGLQNTSWAMQISIAGGVLNLLLDLLLVYGIEGVMAPQGLAGVAWASLASQVLMFSLALWFLFRKAPVGIRLTRRTHPDLGRMLGMSADLFIRTIALNTAYYFGTRFSTDYGEDYIAAYSIAMNIWLFASFLIDGYAGAGNAISGRLIGAGNLTALRILGIDLLRVNILVGCALAVVFLAVYPFMGGWFSSDPDVVVLFNGIFWVVILCQPTNALAFTFDGMFKGLGRMALLRNVLVVSVVTVFIPVLLIMDYFGWKLVAVWVAFLVWMLSRGIPLIWVFFKTYPANQNPSSSERPKKSG